MFLPISSVPLESAQPTLIHIFVSSSQERDETQKDESTKQEPQEQPKEITWRDNPNGCTDLQWIAQESPYYCIDIPTTHTEDTEKPSQKPSERISTSQTIKDTSKARTSGTTNLYTNGQCTFYAKSMRPDLPNNLGNADTWTVRAAQQGFSTGTTPQAGSIGQKGMHVVFVESVNGDGTFNLSEWNYRRPYEKTSRTVSSAGWSFIY